MKEGERRIGDNMGGRKRNLSRLLIFLCLIFLIPSCGHRYPPERPDNICEIFRERRSWYKKADASSRRWGIPVPVIMAIMQQESSYYARIKPPRTTFLWVFPGPRPSSAYGYAQATESTWDWYRQSTGNKRAKRNNFGDAMDFIGWYCSLSRTKCDIAPNDAYGMYLAYHEGHGGYNRKTYGKKTWLLGVARKVQDRSRSYERQFASCEGEFRRRGFRLWPFCWSRQSFLPNMPRQ
jgi:hypothetical protein